MKRVVHYSGLAKWSIGLNSWYSSFREVKFIHHHSKSLYYYKPYEIKEALKQAEGRKPIKATYEKDFICHDTTKISSQEKNKIMAELLLSDFSVKYPEIKVVVYDSKLHDQHPYASKLSCTTHIFIGNSNKEDDLVAIPVLGENILLLGYKQIYDDFYS